MYMYMYMQLASTEYHSYMQCLPEIVDADVPILVFVKLFEDLGVLLGLLVGEVDVHIPHLRPSFVAHCLQEHMGPCQLVLGGEM